MTKQDQYLELSTYIRCTLAPSPIHGVGVFALRDIPEGERLYIRWTKDIPARWYTLTLLDLKKYFNKSGCEEIMEIIIARWPGVAHGQPFTAPNYDVRMTAFLNHSDAPNYDEKTDTALHDIKAGEEITENYKNMPDWEKVFLWLM